MGELYDMYIVSQQNCFLKKEWGELPGLSG